MTAINHALTGAIIGAAVHQPWLALPIAFLSHYVLDAIPHFSGEGDFILTDSFKQIVRIDALLCLALVATLALSNQKHWLLLSICAFLATAPDLFWINKFLYASRGKLKDWRPNWYSRFAAKIQWSEKPIGAGVEVVWFAAAVAILARLLQNAS